MAKFTLASQKLDTIISDLKHSTITNTTEVRIDKDKLKDIGTDSDVCPKCLRSVTCNDIERIIQSKDALETKIKIVVEKIEQSFEETGTILDIAQACKDVEEYLITEALKVYETNKIKERLKPKPEVAQAPAAATAARKQADTSNVTPKQLNTLTNRLSQEQPQRTSEKERIARALAAFKGELK